MIPFISPGLVGNATSNAAGYPDLFSLGALSRRPAAATGDWRKAGWDAYPAAETAAGAAAAAAGGASPLLSLLPILFSLLQNSGLFGGNDEDEKLNELLAMMKPTQPMYQSPNLKKVDPVVMQALMNQMSRSANWGWPEGMAMDTGFIPQNLSGLPGALRRK